VVSTEFLRRSRNINFDAGAGIQLSEKFLKVVSWYDNEGATSNKVVDFLGYIVAIN